MGIPRPKKNIDYVRCLWTSDVLSDGIVGHGEGEKESFPSDQVSHVAVLIV